MKPTNNESYSKGGDSPPLKECCIGEALDTVASLYPENPAVVVRHQAKRANYREFREEVELVARGLLRAGIQKGDRIGVWATNCSEWILSQFATAKIGAILVNINPSYRAFELEHALRQSECQSLLLIRGFRDIDYASTLASICPESQDALPGNLQSAKLPDLKNLIFMGDDTPGSMFGWDDILRMGNEVLPQDLRARESTLHFRDPINIQYTSGTTGFPKGAVLSHHNIVNNALLVGAAMKFTDRDKLCIPVPFYHCFGMVMGNMVCVIYGSEMVIPAPYFDALATLEAVEQERCTALHGVPTMFIAQLEHPEFKRFDLSSLRTGIMAGSPCPIEVMKQVAERMNCREITIAYGMTETSPVVTQTTTDDPLELRVSTVGPASPHTEIKIVDPATGTTVPLGTQGELCARGYAVMKGYYKNPEATGRTIRADGWLHSGDIATMDENGYCRITGRLKDMIIRGGENIYPREIEEFLYTCPKIKDAYVFGVPDRKYGEQVAAWVMLKEGTEMSEDEIKDFCKGKIADFKIPRYVKFVASFPMTVTGKVRKFKMREAATRELGLEATANIETA